jgi:endo-1,4-beta-D-glucanase Y
MTQPRRFPAPWSAELQPNYYVVRDAAGQQLAYVYYESEPGRRSAAKLLTKDGAHRIAANIAKLPELLEQATIVALATPISSGH